MKAPMSYEQYRDNIMQLDNLIKLETDIDERIELIDKNISLNKEYIYYLRKPIGVKVFFCVLLSIIYFLGLFIFLPQIIVRKNKIKICERRIRYLENYKITLKNYKTKESNRANSISSNKEIELPEYVVEEY